jgi:FKBP-type peptidyl-prolyl cis-trans isomerase FklB
MKPFAFAIFAAVLTLNSATVFAQSDPSLSAQANQAFLAQNAKAPGVTVLSDGLQYTVLAEGAGVRPQSTDKVEVLYSGLLINGKVFDQTQQDTPATFMVYQLIPGWIEALTKMRPGAHWHIVIPANLAYGEKGAGNGLVPPNQTLVFDMTLVSVRHSDD